VGQKIHPTGFRIGITKPHQSIWCSPNKTYRRILQEDYRIRQFFEKEWSKALITKLEIKRQFGRINLFIHAAHSADIPNIDCPDIIKNLVLKLKRDLKESRLVNVRIFNVPYDANASLFIARFLATNLEKRVVLSKAINETSEILEKWLDKKNIEGFKIQVSGRLNGDEIARSEWVIRGSLPLQTLRAEIVYATDKALTIYGILGIKIWIFNKYLL